MHWQHRSRPGAPAGISPRVFPAVLGCVFLVLVVVAQTIAAEAERSELQLVTRAGKRVIFQVEVADSVAEKRRGLMFRETLAPTHGMLFLYQPPTEVAIWMKNTPLPLDIIFIGADGRILRIAPDAVPLSEQSMRSGAPVRAVLEINGGLTATLGVGVGDRVLYAPVWPGPD